MSEKLFTNSKDRDDFIIALAVIGFFLWLFLFSGILGKKRNLQNVASDIVFYDADKDGIEDKLDSCPKVFAKTDTGCPEESAEKEEIDTDGDGLVDQDDACPNQYGTSLTGCPTKEVAIQEKQKNQKLVPPVITKPKKDRDLDGVPDRVDRCPDEQGVQENDGCPIIDSDNDGVEDEIDLCPDSKGPLKTKGCPDTDQDGVIDSKDDCPNVKGDSKNGCPELVLEEGEQKILDEAVKNVEFDFASANLTEGSKIVLDQVALLLKKYPEAKLTISGHTDNDASEQRNLKLSEYRALSCKAYLQSKSISEDRLIAKWYGESSPIASNDTPEGRQKNRRVEFSLAY